MSDDHPTQVFFARPPSVVNAAHTVLARATAKAAGREMPSAEDYREAQVTLKALGGTLGFDIAVIVGG